MIKVSTARIYPRRVISWNDVGALPLGSSDPAIRWGRVVSIGKRFIDLARAELNSLLDFASRRGGDDGEAGDFEETGSDGLAGFSRQELEEELARRRAAHAEVEEAIHGRRAPPNAEAPGPGGPPPGNPRSGPSAGTGRSGASGSGPGGRPGPGAATTDRVTTSSVERAYATLEVPMGSSFETVRRSYRTLMRKYHPDRHTSSPEKQRAANEIAQGLTEAYKLLQKRLER
jgi:DnaJ-domain-containing protein 1